MNGYGPLIAFGAVVVALCVWAFVSIDSMYEHRGDAMQKIERICENRGGATYYDVEGQNNVAWVCNNEGAINLMRY